MLPAPDGTQWLTAPRPVTCRLHARNRRNHKRLQCTMDGTDNTPYVTDELHEQTGYLLRRTDQRHTSLFQTAMPDDLLTSIHFAVLAGVQGTGKVAHSDTGRAGHVHRAADRYFTDRLLFHASRYDGCKRALFWTHHVALPAPHGDQPGGDGHIGCGGRHDRLPPRIRCHPSSVPVYRRGPCRNTVWHAYGPVCTASDFHTNE